MSPLVNRPEAIFPSTNRGHFDIMQFENPSDFAQPITGRRQVARLRTNLRVKITSLHFTAHGHLLDLSLTGAKFALPRLISHGVEVLLQWPGSDAHGEIAWVEHRHCGVQFSGPIAAEDLMMARANSLPVPLSRVQELAAEFVRERDYRSLQIARNRQKVGGPHVAHGSRFGLRRV